MNFSLGPVKQVFGADFGFWNSGEPVFHLRGVNIRGKREAAVRRRVVFCAGLGWKH